MNIDINTDKIILKGRRISLRAFCKDDLEDFYEYAKTPGLGEAAGWFHHKSLEDSKKVLDFFIKNKNILAIVKDKKVIGSIGIHKYDEEFFANLSDKKTAQLGFVLSNDYQGQGLMTEALELIISYLFDDYGLDVLVGGFYRGNFKSKSLHEKLNYKYYSSHLTKTNMGTLEVTHEYILEKKDFMAYLDRKNEDLEKRDAQAINSNPKQKISYESIEESGEFEKSMVFANSLIFVKAGLVKYEDDLYIAGDLIKIDKTKTINLEGLRDSQLIIVENDI